MKKKSTILEVTENMKDGNFDKVIAAIYLTDNDEYWWQTSVSSGVCKKLSTARRKIGWD
jgi:hypothetical protein